MVPTKVGHGSQHKVVQALRVAAKEAGNSEDVPVAAFQEILQRFVFPTSPAEALRIVETCAGSVPGSINYKAFLRFVEDIPVLAGGKSTADRQVDNLTTASPWQVCSLSALPCVARQPIASLGRWRVYPVGGV